MRTSSDSREKGELGRTGSLTDAEGLTAASVALIANRYKHVGDNRVLGDP